MSIGCHCNIISQQCKLQSSYSVALFYVSHSLHYKKSVFGLCFFIWHLTCTHLYYCKSFLYIKTLYSSSQYLYLCSQKSRFFALSVIFSIQTLLYKDRQTPTRNQYLTSFSTSDLFHFRKERRKRKKRE